MSKRTRAFKRRNPQLIESDSERSDSGSDSEEENEDYEIDSDEEVPAVENLKFELGL